nr:hypothetical protein [Tawny frogmouth aviadenovirus A]
MSTVSKHEQTLSVNTQSGVCLDWRGVGEIKSYK